jgi:hypothetical protein
MPAAKKVKGKLLDFQAGWQIKDTAVAGDVEAYGVPSLLTLDVPVKWTLPGGPSLGKFMNFSGQTAQYLSAFSVSPPVVDLEALGLELKTVQSHLEVIQARLGGLEERLSKAEKVSQRVVAGFLNTLSDERLELQKPIAVTVEFDEDDYVVARWTEALLEGEGRSQLEAISELRSQIVEAYLDAEAEVAAGFEPDGYPKILWTLLSEFVKTKREGQPG